MMKHISDQYRKTIIRKQIANNTHYDDVDVPLTEPLLKMVQKRAWASKDGNVTSPSFLRAMEGLSPFLMLDLSEDEVAAINDEADLIQRASMVSVQDLRALKRKMKINIPDTAEGFIILLKKFTNLVFVLFLSQSPLFKCVREVIDAIKAYSREARKKMSIQTKGSILWIILLQARQFGIGKSTYCMNSRQCTMNSVPNARKYHIMKSWQNFWKTLSPKSWKKRLTTGIDPTNRRNKKIQILTVGTPSSRRPW